MKYLWLIAAGLGLGVVWVFRKPLGWVGDAASSLTSTVVNSPVFQDPEYTGKWLAGVPDDVARLLDPPLPPPPPGTPIESDAHLRWLWKESGEYHPIYNP